VIDGFNLFDVEGSSEGSLVDVSCENLSDEKGVVSGWHLLDEFAFYMGYTFLNDRWAYLLCGQWG